MSEVSSLPGIRVSAVAVEHGMMPALAYRVETDDASLAFSGDVSGESGSLAELASDVDLLVHDMALPERDVEHGDLHAKPSEVGRTASAARAGSLLLSHVMPELEDEKDDAERLVRSNFSGPVSWAHDLMSVPVRSAD